MADHIPNELLDDILVRLPVASLLRFTSVCKSWYSLITSPSFITKHLNQTVTNSRRNDNKLIVRTCNDDWYKERYLLLHADDKFGYEHTELEFPCKRTSGYSIVVGSCNGLLACRYDDFISLNHRIIIWNPSIRKSVSLPMTCETRPDMVVYGFGAHPTTHEYKVVRITYDFRQIYKIPPEVEVNTQGTRSWRGIGSAAAPYYIDRWSQAFLNGVVHWVAYYLCEDGGLRNVIVSFNMASESFSEIMLPPTLANQPQTSVSTMVFGESIAVSHRGERDGSDGCIWVMKEYGVAESWTKIFSSNLLGMPNKILGFRGNGEILLATATRLAYYDPITKTLRYTGIRGTSREFYVDSFIETLVLAEKRNGVSQGLLNLS